MTDLICVPWATPDDLVCDELDVDDEMIFEGAILQASEVLFLLSGRRWPGECSDVVRPCARPVCGPSGCSCGGLSVVKLGPGLWAVSQVKLDGDVLIAGTDYRVDTHHDELVKLRSASGNSWPCFQDLTLADTEDRTFSVAYTFGANPPAGGVAAAAELACQLALARAGVECKLPPRAQSVSRQGLTITMSLAADVFDKGLTGLGSVDLWLRSVNPNGLSRRAKVISPDTMTNHRRIG